MNEIIEKLLLKRRIERKRNDFQQEVRDVYRKKAKPLSLLYLLLLLPLLGALLFYFFPESGDRKSAEEQKESVATLKPPAEANAVKTEAPSAKPAELQQPEKAIREVEVLKPKTLVYSINNDLGDFIASLEKGSVLELIEEVEGWRKVRYGDRKIGWVKAENTASVQEKKLKTLLSEKIVIEKKTTEILAKEFLEDWGLRTESLDINRYRELYDPEFSGQGMDVSAWMERKKGIFKNARFILIGIKDIKVLEETDSTLKVSFTQYYNNSDKMKVTSVKVLDLRKTKNGYRVLKENAL